MKTSPRGLALFALNIAVWGYNWIALHIVLGAGVGANTAAAARIVLGALALFAMLLALRKPLSPPRTWGFVWVGLLQVTGMIGLSTGALLEGGVSRTVLLVFTMPLWATLIERLVFHAPIGPRRWTALAIATGGLAFIASGARTAPELSGAVLATASGASWAAGTVLAKRIGTDGDVLRAVAWQQVAGAIPLVVIAIFAHEHLPAVSAFVVANFLFVAIVGSGVGWFLWNASIELVAPGTLTLGALLVPIVASLAAFVQLHERPDPQTLGGLAIVLAGLVVASLPIGQSHPAKAAGMAPERGVRTLDA